MLTFVTPTQIKEIKELMISRFRDCSQMIAALNIQEICNYTDENKELGSGAYGVVRVARNPQNNELVVLKSCKSKDAYYLRVSTVRELCAISQFNHQNILKLLNICADERIINGRIQPKFTLVLELCRCDLGQVAFSSINYEEAHCKSIFQQILQGLEHIHGLNIIHRDLKPTNILIGRDGLVKIADFGLSRLKNKEDRYTPYIGTKGYMAPEIMLELGKYNEGFDMFAAGIILSEIYLREFLFKGDTLTSIAKSMVRILGKINNRNLPGSQESDQYVHLFCKVRSGAPQLRKVLSNCCASEDAINLAEKLLAINPAERPKANEALKYPYFVNSPQPDGNILPLLPRTWGIP